MSASYTFYKEYIESDLSVEELAAIKGIKPSSGCVYIRKNYDPRDAKRLKQKLGLTRETIERAFSTLVQAQEYRKLHPHVKVESLAFYINAALGKQCQNCCLATSIIRKLYNDLCTTN